jgi:hypothetical protein
MRTSLLILLALACAPAAWAAGPWLGTASTGAGFTAAVDGGTTVVGDGSHTLRLAGRWGIPRVTLDGDVGGLSRDGRILVLAQEANHPNGELSATSTFTVLRTKPLRVERRIVLHGDFGFDALSPHGRTLYLIEHVSQRELFRYRVRAYDVPAGRLLGRVVADKRQRSWLMNGYPVARAASAGGRWVYTLYTNPDNYPVVHALDTVSRTAVCVGLPWDWTGDQAAMNNATLRVTGNTLAIGDSFSLDRTTFEVTKR